MNLQFPGGFFLIFTIFEAKMRARRVDQFSSCRLVSPRVLSPGFLLATRCRCVFSMLLVVSFFSVRGLGHTFLKNVRPELWGERRELLCMESPTTPDIDLGKNAFNISNVRAAFHQAFADLMALEVAWAEAEAQWRAAAVPRGCRPDAPLPRLFAESLLAHLFDPSHPIFSLREPRPVKTREETLRSLLGLGCREIDAKSLETSRREPRGDARRDGDSRERTEGEKEREESKENAQTWAEADLPLELMEEVAATFLLASWSENEATQGRPKPKRTQAKGEAEKKGEGNQETADGEADADNQRSRLPGSVLTAPQGEAWRNDNGVSDADVDGVFSAFQWTADSELVKEKMTRSYAAFLARLTALAS